MIEREKAKKKSQRIQGGLITITSDLPADISMNGAEVGVIERRGERYFGVPAGSFVVTLTHVDESSGQKISLSKAGVMTLSGEHELSFEFLSIDPSEREDEPLPDPQKSVHTSPLTD